MLVSLFTDASFSIQKREGACGFWIKSDRGRRQGSKKISRPVRTVDIAEMMAVANGLVFGWRTGVIRAEDTVLIQTDSLAAIHKFHQKKKIRDPEAAEIVKLVKDFATIHCLDLKFRHVKGHSSKGAPRFMVNKLVDKLAGQARKRK